MTFARRLIAYYLAFALAGVFACLVMVIAFTQFRGLPFSPGLLAVPLVVVSGGAFYLYRLVRVNANIEAQLTRVGNGETDVSNALVRMPDCAPLTRGWNLLVQQLQERVCDITLNSKLENFVQTFNQQGWESIVNSLPVGIATSDSHGNFIRANRATLAFLGVANVSETVGRGVLELLEEHFPPSTKAVWDELRHGSGSITRDIQLGEQLSEGVWRITRSPLIERDEPTGNQLWTVRDITQQRLAEEARQQFVATATHELRTPLANIKAYADTLTLNENVDPQEQKNFYNVISSEATRLARFVDDLLNVSQMETGAITVTRNDVDIQRLIEEITQHVAPQCQQKQIQFESKLPQKYPKVRADKDKLSAALVNLIGNAIKYTPEAGWVQFTVEADDNQMRFVVEDNGIGIAANELPKLCQKFFRSSDSRVRKITGSGLGLAFTQEVAKLHGGSVTVSSELNKGSRFTLSLPLR